MLINPDICDILVKKGLFAGGKKYTYDLNMEPYTAIGNPSAAQMITSYLIEYKIDDEALDVELYDVIVPSLKDIHRRKNPTTAYPIIEIKNHSAKTIKSLNITYGTKGLKMYSEVWSGEIKPFEVVEIELKNRVDNVFTTEEKKKEKESEFIVTVTAVNGEKDTYEADNRMVSQFKPVEIHKGNFEFLLLSNNESERENRMTLRNMTTGKTVFEYGLGDIKNDQLLKEKITLESGDYFFEVTDGGGNGLSFWANKKGGKGDCFIMDNNKSIVKYFNPDFGNSIRYWFRVDSNLEIENLQKEPIVKIKMVNHAKATINYITSNKKDKIKIVVKSYVGRVGKTIVKEATEGNSVDVDMTSYPSGLYFVEVWQNECKGNATFNVKELKK